MSPLEILCMIEKLRYQLKENDSMLRSSTKKKSKKEAIHMSVSNADLFKLVTILPEETKQSAYDFLKFLTIQHSQPSEEINELNLPDGYELIPTGYF